MGIRRSHVIGRRNRDSRISSPLNWDGSSYLAAWHRASADTTLMAGTAVTQVNDRTAHGYHMLAVGDPSTRPTYRATGFRDKPCIEFDGASNYLLEATGLANAVFTGTNNPFTLYVVGSLRALLAIETFVAAQSASNAHPYTSIFARQSDTHTALGHRDDASVAPVGPEDRVTATTGDLLFEATFDGANVSFIQITSAGDISTGTLSASFPIGAMTVDRYSFGATFAGGSLANFGHVSIADHLLYSAALTESQRSANRDHLQSYWFGL